MNLGLVLGEAFNGLRRNASMVISIVLVTFVSLTFVGAAVLMQAQISTMRAFWGERAQVAIYMCSPLSTSSTCVDGAATAEQVEAVRAELEGPTLAPLISTVDFDSKEDTYQNNLDFFGDDMGEILTLDQSYEVFRVGMVNTADVAVITEAFSGVAGVDDVTNQMQYLEPLFAALTIATYIAVGIAGLMLIAAVLLIGTTIRLSAFARRREIGIMRLVGASNRIIQTPFILEGVLAGFIGSLLAGAAVIAGVHFGVTGYLTERIGFIVTWVGVTEAIWVAIGLIAVGIVLSAISAGFAIRRWLKA